MPATLLKSSALANTALTGTTSVQTLSPDIADLGTVASGDVTLSTTKAWNKVVLSGSAATIVLPDSPPNGSRVLIASITGNVALAITTPLLLRVDAPSLGAVTSISIAAATAGIAVIQFLANGGAYYGMTVIGDDVEIPSDVLAGLSTDGTNASPSHSTWLSSQAYALHLAATLDALTLPYTDINNFPTGTLAGRSTAATGAIESITVGAGLTLTGGTLAATATGSSTPVEITTTDIDWSTGGVFTDTIGANTTYTFSNTTDGQTIRVLITASGAYSVTWPANVYGAPSQTSTATDLYQFTRIGVFIVASRLAANLTIDTAPPEPTSWTINTDGDELTVVFDKDVTVTDGAGVTLSMSGGGMTVSSTPTGTGTSTLVFALTGRTVGAGETGTCSYDGAGGIVGEANGVAVADWTAETVTNNASGSTYTFTEDFTEPSGTPSGWTTVTGSPNYQYTPALIGDYSLSVPNGAVVYRDIGVDKDEQWFFVRATVAAGAVGELISLRNSSGTTIAYVEARTDRINAYHGTASSGNLATHVTGESCYWIRYVKGTGSDGILTVYVERGGTTESRGSPIISITNGNATAAVRRFTLRCPGSGTNVYDKIRASDAAILDTPV